MVDPKNLLKGSNSRLLSAARSYKRLTQKQAADKLGLFLHTLVDLERGRVEPTLEWLDNACNKLMESE